MVRPEATILLAAVVLALLTHHEQSHLGLEVPVVVVEAEAAMVLLHHKAQYKEQVAQVEQQVELFLEIHLLPG